MVNQHAKEYPELPRSVRLKQVDLTESRYRRLREGVERRRGRESAIPPEDVAAGVDFFVRRPEVGAGKAHDALVDSGTAWVSAAALNETKSRLADAAAEEHERRRARSKLEQETKARLRLSMSKAGTYTHVTPAAPNEIWATDFLHIRFLSFDFYLCVVYDVFSQRCLALIPGDYPDSDLAAKAIREARRKSGTSPKRYLIFDNGKAFLSKDYQDILRLLGTTPRVLPPHSPWFNGSLEANNRTLRSTIVSVGVQTLADTGADTLRLRQNRGQALNALNDFCVETSQILNDEIPRPKFHVTPSTVMAGGTSEAQERHRRFIEHKKQQRKERMRKIRDGEIKTGRESLAEKAVKAARKAVRALSHDRLFALNELLCGRTAAFTV